MGKEQDKSDSDIASTQVSERGLQLATPLSNRSAGISPSAISLGGVVVGYDGFSRLTLMARLTEHRENAEYVVAETPPDDAGNFSETGGDGDAK